MKSLASFLLFIIVVGWSEMLIAQTEENHPSQNEACTGLISVQATRMNVLYLGIKNNISVNIWGIPREKYKIRTDNGIITTRSDMYYDIIPEKEGYCNIYVSYGSNPEEYLQFRCKKLPKPDVRLISQDNTKISLTESKVKISDVQRADRIDVGINDFDYYISFELVEPFTITRISESQVISKTVNDGFTFNDDNVSILKSALTGDIFMISGLKVKCIEVGTIYYIDDLTFTVVK